MWQAWKNNRNADGVLVGTAQSVWQLAMGWTVRGSNPGWGEFFRTRPDRAAHPPIQWVPSLSPGVKRPGRGVDHPPHLAPRLKKE